MFLSSDQPLVPENVADLQPGHSLFNHGFSDSLFSDHSRVHSPPLRILVLGDLAVGKSSLLRLICQEYHTLSQTTFEDGKLSEDTSQRSVQLSGKDLPPVKNDTPPCHGHFKDCPVTIQGLRQRRAPCRGRENSDSPHRAAAFSYNSTVGCEIHVKLHPLCPDNLHSTEGLFGADQNHSTVESEVVWWPIEFWDISGTQKHAALRSVFYDHFDGILLVYDVSNPKSYHNLSQWLYEIFSRRVPPSAAFFETHEHCKITVDTENPAVAHGDFIERLPIAVVANKYDLTDSRTTRPSKVKYPTIMPLIDRLFGGMAIYMHEFWESRLPADERLRLKILACRVLDSAPQIAFSVKYRQADLNTLDRFLQRSSVLHH